MVQVIRLTAGHGHCHQSGRGVKRRGRFQIEEKTSFEAYTSKNSFAITR